MAHDIPTRSERGAVVIIEDHEGYAEAVIAPPFRPHFDVYFAHNIPHGRELLHEEGLDVRAVFVDLDLPGGTPFDPDEPGGYGFELVALARRRFPLTVPVFVLTAHVHPRLINQAQALGAEYLAKYGNESENLEMVAERLRSWSRVRDEHAARWIATMVGELGLTDRHREILSLSVTGMRHKEIARLLGISTNTVKRHVDTILRRSNAASMAEIRERFRDAVWG